jgi:hypothetical protein
VPADPSWPVCNVTIILGGSAPEDQEANACLQHLLQLLLPVLLSLDCCTLMPALCFDATLRRRSQQC